MAHHQRNLNHLAMQRLMDNRSDWPPSDLFRVEVGVDQGQIRVALHGELDLAAVEQAEGALRGAEGDGQNVVVDFSDLRFMDLSGLNLMLAAHQRLGDRLTLRGCSPQVHRLLELTGADEQLPLVD